MACIVVVMRCGRMLAAIANCGTSVVIRSVIDTFALNRLHENIDDGIFDDARPPPADIIRDGGGSKLEGLGA